jgi:hypothetical protein
MILESLINDGSKVALDCAKTSVTGPAGSKVEIADALFWHPEVQGAIKLGFAKPLGDIPPEPPAAVATAAEKKVKFKNNYKTKLTFDCIKGTVEPGHFIEIPVSKVNDAEVANAVAYGMLEDVDNPKPPKAEPSEPVDLEEVKVSDGPAAPPAPSAKAKPKPITGKKAKPISKAKDVEDAVDEDKNDPLYIESKIQDPGVAPAKKGAPEPKDEEEEDDDTFAFLDIFGNKE